jgi:hypothetical protein
MKITITVSDPWAVGEALNWRPISATVVSMRPQQEQGTALIEFDPPLEYDGRHWRFGVASPRHVGDRIAALDQGPDLFAAVTTIDNDSSRSNWRAATERRGDGLYFIGNIQVQHTGVTNEARNIIH